MKKAFSSGFWLSTSRRRKNSFTPISFLLLMVQAHIAAAQTAPSLINYQGRLSDSNGTPLVTGDYQLTFNIYDATTGGNLIWGPQIFDGSTNGVPGHGSKIPIVQGYFNVILGPNDTNSHALTDGFTNSPRFVEIRIGTNSPIVPRQQILSAPFALNSSKLAGADWSAVFGTNDPVNGRIPTTKLSTNGVIIAQQIGVNTTNPASTLEVHGNIALARQYDSLGPGSEAFVGIPASSPGAFGGAGASISFTQGGTNGLSNDIRFYTHLSGVGGAERMRIADNGNVGIGTSNPGYRLDVNGGLRLTSNQNASSQDGALHIARLDDPNRYIFMGYDAGNYGFIQPVQSGTGFRNLVLNQYGGNVGIGTVAPAAHLEVQAVQTSDFLRLSRVDASQEYLDIAGMNEPGQGTGFSFQTRHYNGGSYDTRFPLYLSTSGSVGIGTNGPTATLDVIGTIRATGNICANGVSCASDRNLKENFTSINPREVLEKVSELPLSRWNFKTDPQVSHLGPMAQDFYAAFQVGADDRHISTTDESGIALAALQGLNQKLDAKLKEKDAEIGRLKAREDRLEARLRRLEEAVSKTGSEESL